MKKAIQEKIEEIKTKGSSWLEPLKEFIKEAADAAKIARAPMKKPVNSRFHQALFNYPVSLNPDSIGEAFALLPYGTGLSLSHLFMLPPHRRRGIDYLARASTVWYLPRSAA